MGKPTGFLEYQRQDSECIAPKERIKNFNEFHLPLSEKSQQMQGARCMACGVAFCQFGNEIKGMVSGCPLHNLVPEWNDLVYQGNWKSAYDRLVKTNCFPEFTSRVCPALCEAACTCGLNEEPVSTKENERAIIENAFRTGLVKPISSKVKTGKKIAIVGSGPAGLACASDLAKMGYGVTIFEALHEPGGVLQYGIPDFRLPKEDVVCYEIDNVRSLGVEIETNVVVGRTVTIDSLLGAEGFSAVFVGSGAGLPKFMDIPGENLNGVVSANEFLTRNNLMKAYDPDFDTPIYVGKRVAVVGGGNVAMDAARTALRLGAEVTIVYRRTEKELPARVEEVHHAKEEGIVFRMLTNPVEILSDEKGWVKGLKCIKMELGEPDEGGRRSPVPIPDSHFDIETDVVVMSLGTSPNPLIASTTDGLETNKWGCIVAGEDGATSRPGVFAGGDAVTGAATVILAMGAGRKAAEAIDKWLNL